MKQTLTALPAFPRRPGFLGGLLLLGFAACASPTETRNPELEGRGARWSGDAVRNASLNNAIIAQHTLYPFHFVSGSAELNSLGQRDLNVLANHLVKSPGDVNVRRGDAPQALYEARVKAVLERLAAAGVQGGSVAVKDGLPGGDGMPSERVIVILKEKMSPVDTMSTGSRSNNSGNQTSGSSTGIQ